MRNDAIGNFYLPFDELINHKDYRIRWQNSEQVRPQTCIKSFKSLFFIHILKNILHFNVLAVS